MAHLDLATLMTMESFVAVCSAGAVFFGWWKQRDNSALGLWALATLLVAVGVYALMLGATESDLRFTIAGGAILTYAPGLLWKAVGTLEGRRVPLPLALVGPLIVIVLPGVIPPLRAFGGSINLGAATIYLCAAAVTLWRGRDERLAARGPLALLIGIHALTLGVGAVATALGLADQNSAPPVASLFGVIHFEGILFNVGTSGFLLAFIREREEANTRAAAKLDSLTGLANRGAFFEAAEAAIARCREANEPISAVMFDLDRFKAINDNFGHAAGDSALRKFGDIVKSALRRKDILGRIGGEEFAALLPGCDIEAAIVRADRIRAIYAASARFIEGLPIAATVSGGVAISIAGEKDLAALLAEADKALYLAKNHGRNAIRRAADAQNPPAPAKVLRIA